MKYFELDKTETEIVATIEKGNFRRIKNFANEKSAFHSYAENALKKTRSINVRLSEGDLLKLKAMAMEEGIPYQTFFTSIVHKYLRQKAAG
ncbi:MAG: hypothetical protein A3D65_04920 [Candidatus Lloydbacteria bacterium RIFCSPHIGHO2_02_FULL_50_13]|uniref:Antitoxin n=1 Tax=Candidatus Lloydbacteria bacterium RIFCSPHIGHO2_02_FULL_50_13 TaxID=1798661 RepID=A0A1G2D733_9BACT|nr:MAG: hypothetical protein A3D65_04920 [Candidatus Lloydbacteria bacterium RIFCSPHIGHO2_02_FULL_50_13]